MFKKVSMPIYAITAGIGAIVFWVICGPSLLNPLNDAWLLGGGDLTQQYFGWSFFRHGPWNLPLGLNPMYGMDISSSIVYSDANPLLSLLFKPFNALLPSIFQFQGIWLLICLVLQAYFACKILGLYTADKVTQVLGSCLFIFAVPMLFRVGVHTNLAAHFLILASLYLNLRPRQKNQPYWWASLLLISLGVHFYIFAMIFVLWIADLGDRTFSQKSLGSKNAFKSFLITLLCIAFCAWQLGYFAVKAPSLFGYGFFKANVLSIFNPNGWSYFLKNIAIKSSWGEGNLYLGIGVMLLWIIGLLKARQWLSRIPAALQHYPFLISSLFLLSLFSITNQIGIGPFEFRVPLPEWLFPLLGILRHSARMFWPVYYAIIIAGCVIVLTSYRPTFSRIIFALCLVLQVLDLSPGIAQLRTELHAPIQNDLTSTPLRQPFWNLAGERYKSVYVLPSRAEPDPDFMSRFMGSDWKIFGHYASQRQLYTNAVYLSRYDAQKQAAAFEHALELSKTGLYDPRTLYIIKNEDLIPVALNLKDPQALLARIDGYNVLAPGLLGSVDLKTIGQYDRIDLKSLSSSAQQKISFERPESQLSSYALTRGWNNREDWGTWSKGKSAMLMLPIPSPLVKSVKLSLRAFVNGAIPEQVVHVYSEGLPLGNFSLTKFDGNTIEVKIPDIAKQQGYLLLNLELPNAASPASVGIGDDSRELGIGIVAVQFD